MTRAISVGVLTGAALGAETEIQDAPVAADPSVYPWRWPTTEVPVRTDEEAFSTPADLSEAAQNSAKTGPQIVTADCSFAFVGNQKVADRVGATTVLSILNAIDYIASCYHQNARFCILTSDADIFQRRVTPMLPIASEVKARLDVIDLVQTSFHDEFNDEEERIKRNQRDLRSLVIPKIRASQPEAVIASCTDLWAHVALLRASLAQPVYDLAALIDFHAAAYGASTPKGALS